MSTETLRISHTMKGNNLRPSDKVALQQTQDGSLEVSHPHCVQNNMSKERV